MKPAIFLDRDGTINIEKKYLFKSDDFEFESRADEAIAILNKEGYKVIVITNQAGVARGYYQETDVVKLHEWMNEQLAQKKAHIDGFYYCPHHPEHGIEKYKKDCQCRKPAIGLIEQAIREHNIDISKSYFIGDRETDIYAGMNVGMRTILVLTGYGKKSFKLFKGQNLLSADNLYDAVYKYIVKSVV